jgi:hypothetical protein
MAHSPGATDSKSSHTVSLGCFLIASSACISVQRYSGTSVRSKRETAKHEETAIRHSESKALPSWLSSMWPSLYAVRSKSVQPTPAVKQVERKKVVKILQLLPQSFCRVQA